MDGDFAEEPQLFELPMEVLARVMNFSSCDESSLNQVFGISLRLLGRLGSVASPLFATLDLKRLNAGDIQSLLNHKSFLHYFLYESVSATLLEFVSMSSRHDDLISKQQETVDALQAFRASCKQRITSLEDRNKQAEAAIHRLQQQMSAVPHGRSFPVQNALADGTISYLTTCSRGNVHGKAIVHMTASGEHSHDFIAPCG
jgi:hypothetical protein